MHEVGELHIKAAACKVVISASISLFVMLADLAFVMRDECKHVLPQLRSSWHSRLYVAVRSIGLLGQLFNVYFSFRMFLGIYTSPAGCYVWFSYQALIVQTLLFYVEHLLAKRVLALFLGSQAILMLLVAFLLAQVSSMVVSAQFSIRTNQYTPSCWVTKSSPGNAFFSATTMTTHFVIFFMTLWRFFRLPKEFTHNSLGRSVFWSSMLTLAAISVIMLFLTLTSLEVIKHTMSGNIVFSWLVCTLWISMGRIYVSQEAIKQDAVLSKMWEGSMRLTSQIEVGEVSTFGAIYSSSDGLTASTLQESLSTPTGKASELALSSVGTSNGPQEWPRDAPPSSGCASEDTSQGEDWQGYDYGSSSSSQLRSQSPLSERGSGDDPGGGSQPYSMGPMEASGGDTLPSDAESSKNPSSHLS